MSTINLFLRIVGPFVRPIYGGAGVILMFHRILPKDRRARIPGRASLESTPEILEQTIAYFAKHNYEVFSPDDLYGYLIGEKKSDKPFVLFTFDDGYVDNLTYAYPIFKKHDIPFTIHVSTCFPERTAVIWWYLLEDLILEQKHLAFEYAGQSYDFDCSTLEGKAKAYGITRKLFKFANIQQRAKLTNSVLLANHVNLLKKAAEVALSWDQLKQLASDPLVTLSVHTANHYVLTSLTDNEVKFEISESKRILEDKLGRQIDYFAYPFGERREAGEREFRITAECGFKTAMTTRVGNIFPEHGSNLMTLPRYDMMQLDIPQDFDLITSGALSMRVNRLRRVVTS